MPEPKEMYRIVAKAFPIPAHEGEQAAKDIVEDIIKNWPFQESPVCTYETDTHSLILKVENDYDSQGFHLYETFTNFVIGWVCDLADFEVKIESVTKFQR
jgi:hypothetical protein